MPWRVRCFRQCLCLNVFVLTYTVVAGESNVSRSAISSPFQVVICCNNTVITSPLSISIIYQLSCNIFLVITASAKLSPLQCAVELIFFFIFFPFFFPLLDSRKPLNGKIDSLARLGIIGFYAVQTSLSFLLRSSSSPYTKSSFIYLFAQISI
jgi:hypothetical protein